MLLSAFFCFIPWQMCGRAEIKYNKCCKNHLLPARRYASCDPVSVSVCHKLEFYRNSCMNRAGFFGIGTFFHLSYTVLKRNSGIFKLRNIDRRLSSSARQDGRSERD